MSDPMPPEEQREMDYAANQRMDEEDARQAEALQNGTVSVSLPENPPPLERQNAVVLSGEGDPGNVARRLDFDDAESVGTADTEPPNGRKSHKKHSSRSKTEKRKGRSSRSKTEKRRGRSSRSKTEKRKGRSSRSKTEKRKSVKKSRKGRK
jgi:hypothetical protein